MGRLFALLTCMLFAQASMGVDTDTDGDGVVDLLDNCRLVGNWQTDTDGDGYGNRCDGDLNNDGVTNGADFSAWKGHYIKKDSLVCDHTEDGVCDGRDFFLFARELFNNPPGPNGMDIGIK